MMNWCSYFVALTMCQMVMRQISWPPSITGRWRRLFSVISDMHWSPVWFKCTYITGLDMMSRSGVSFGERAISTSLRA